MSSKKLTEKQTKIFAWLFVLIGLPFIGIAFSIIEVDPSTVHAPLWIIGLCGFVFSMAGVMVLLGEKSPINNLLGGLLVLSFAVVGGWIAFFGDADQFSGGIPLLTESNNVIIARILFGSGSLVCFLVAIYAFKLQFKPKKGSKE